MLFYIRANASRIAHAEFIRNIRLKAAKQFLEQRKGNITKVAFMVGFSSPTYFSTKFKEKYDVKPSEV
ncbi:MAG: helix-turn-helix domain-containing protein [Saprospiraceae bacterium]